MVRYFYRRYIFSFVCLLIAFFAINSLAFAGTLFIWPVNGAVTTNFGYTPYQKDGHRGIDIQASSGTPVKSVAEGRVYWTGTSSEGPGVGVEHENGMRTTYISIAKSVKQEQIVKQGDIIGTVIAGSSPSSDAHVHFGVKAAPYGEKDYLNPLDLLSSLAGQDTEPKTNLSGTSAVPAPPIVSSNPGPVGSAGSNPTAVPKQVPVSVNQVASVRTTESSLPESNPEPVRSVQTAPNLQESSSGQTSVSETNLSELPANDGALEKKSGKSPISNMVAPSVLLQDTELVAASNGYTKKSIPLRTGAAATDGISDAGAATNTWQITLLIIAGSLVLLFMLKKGINSYRSSHLWSEPVLKEVCI